MQLPKFTYVAPNDLDEALALLNTHQDAARILAGGSDLLVRMKQRLLAPAYLISLKHLDSLAYIRTEKDSLVLGARTTLAQMIASEDIGCLFKGFLQACRSVGAPSIQHYSATLGGNLCQENRCAHYNQSRFWRASKQPCHKAGGQICYAQEGSDRCRSTCCSDLAPILIALNARAEIRSRRGVRTIPLIDLYTTKGEAPLALNPDELLTGIEISVPMMAAGSAYEKLAFRSAVDYPVLSVGAAVQAVSGEITKARIVIGAITSAPLFLAQASESLHGKRLTDQTAFEAAAAMAQAHASVFAVDNVHAPTPYRIDMIPVLTERALKAAAAQALERA